MRTSVVLYLIGAMAFLLPAASIHASNGGWAEDRSSGVSGYEDDDFVPKRVAMNVRNYEVTPQVFYESAYRALLKREWKVETNEQTRLVGSLSEDSQLYKVEILYADDIITVRFVEGHHNPYGRRWLKNLASDIKKQIAPLKKNLRVVPPAPTPVPAATPPPAPAQ